MTSNHVHEDLHFPETLESKLVLAVVYSSDFIVRLKACARKGKDASGRLEESSACFVILHALEELFDWRTSKWLTLGLDYEMAIYLIADFGREYVEEACLDRIIC